MNLLISVYLLFFFAACEKKVIGNTVPVVPTNSQDLPNKREQTPVASLGTNSDRAISTTTSDGAVSSMTDGTHSTSIQTSTNISPASNSTATATQVTIANGQYSLESVLIGTWAANVTASAGTSVSTQFRFWAPNSVRQVVLMTAGGRTTLLSDIEGYAAPDYRMQPTRLLLETKKVNFTSGSEPAKIGDLSYFIYKFDFDAYALTVEGRQEDFPTAFSSKAIRLLPNVVVPTPSPPTPTPSPTPVAPTPIPVENYSDISSISSDGSSTCAIRNYKLYCWGEAQAPLPTLARPSEVSLGYERGCAIDGSSVKCWGTSASSAPSSIVNPRKLSVGLSNACVLADNGLKCWGFHGSQPTFSNPTFVATNKNSCAIDAAGVKCWGPDYEYNRTSVPSNLGQVSEVGDHTDITCGMGKTFVRCWGKTGDHYALSGQNFSNLRVGYHHVCAIDNGKVTCLEKDEVCQIANGTVHCQTVPATQIRVGNVPALKNPRLLSSGSGFACAVDDDGVSCWGNDYREQLKVPEALRRRRN